MLPNGIFHTPRYNTATGGYNNNPAYILIKPWTHKANVRDPKSEKKQKLG